MRQRNFRIYYWRSCGRNTQINNGPCTIDSLSSSVLPLLLWALTASAITTDPTTLNFNDIEMKNAVLDASAKKCIVCDSSKFSQGAIAQYASWSRFDLMITDAPLPEELANRITGLEIRIAGNS